MVDYYPLFEFACMIILLGLNKKSSFMLCSFGISTEASAPAVLSLILGFHKPVFAQKGVSLLLLIIIAFVFCYHV